MRILQRGEGQVLRGPQRCSTWESGKAPGRSNSRSRAAWGSRIWAAGVSKDATGKQTHSSTAPLACWYLLPFAEPSHRSREVEELPPGHSALLVEATEEVQISAPQRGLPGPLLQVSLRLSPSRPVRSMSGVCLPHWEAGSMRAVTLPGSLSLAPGAQWRLRDFFPGVPCGGHKSWTRFPGP